MESVDPNIERLIVRRLDGEITEDELLELNRELIRNPAAHRLWEEYVDLDAMAGQAIHQVLDRRSSTADPVALPAQMQPRRFSHLRRHGLMLAGAVAAAVLALAIPRTAVVPTHDNGAAAIRVDQIPPIVDMERTPKREPNDGMMRNVSTPQIQRNTGRDVFGVMDENGNIYWIEVDRTRTLRRPSKETVGRGLRETL